VTPSTFVDLKPFHSIRTMSSQPAVGFGASLTQAITSIVPSPTATLYESGVRLVIYGLVLVLVIGVVLILIDSLYPFLPMNPIGPSQEARAVKTFWVNSAYTNDENLVVPSSKSPTVSPSNWSVSIQLMVGAVSPSAFYKHIVHRGSNPARLPTGATAGASGHAGIQASDLPSVSGIPSPSDATYTTTGLPGVMNPGIFLDKSTNDIHVFIHTVTTEGGQSVLLLESMTITDVPLGTPLTLGIVCNGRTLEVYLNCRLYSTQLLKGTPYLPKADNQWFGRYGIAPMSGLIQNLQLWDAAIGSSDYMAMCGIGSFKKN
jgi:hypothetical protein